MFDTAGASGSCPKLSILHGTLRRFNFFSFAPLPFLSALISFSSYAAANVSTQLICFEFWEDCTEFVVVVVVVVVVVFSTR